MIYPGVKMLTKQWAKSQALIIFRQFFMKHDLKRGIKKDCFSCDVNIKEQHF